LNFSLRQLVVSFFIFFDDARPGLFFILCANARLMISPIKGEKQIYIQSKIKKEPCPVRAKPISRAPAQYSKSNTQPTI